MIRFTGLRPGEKLDEALVSDNEEREPTAHPKIWSSRAPARSARQTSTARLQELYAASKREQRPEVRRLLESTRAPGTGPRLGPPVAAAAAAPYPDDW